MVFVSLKHIFPIRKLITNGYLIKKENQRKVKPLKTIIEIGYGGDLHQPHLGTRIHYYRCSLPGLAGFAVYRREGTNVDHHRRAND